MDEFNEERNPLAANEVSLFIVYVNIKHLLKNCSEQKVCFINLILN